jgi:hypothetical protein
MSPVLNMPLGSDRWHDPDKQYKQHKQHKQHKQYKQHRQHR